MTGYSFLKTVRALSVGVLGAVGITVGSGSAIAQNVIVPDETLGSETSVVSPFRETINHISGGATREKNLFHSFEEFNVEPLVRADFIVESPQITDVFARITGDNFSLINGTLGIRRLSEGRFVLSDANLYLINPNGIIFGEDAFLDLDGSFAAATSSGLVFGNEGIFSASEPEVPSSRLTITPSAYLFGQPSIGNIVIGSTSTVSVPVNRVSGLRVPDGENLSLLGGNIFVGNSSSTTGSENTVSLTARGGQLNIGAVGGTGSVFLDADSSFVFPEELSRANIQFAGNAQANVGLDSGGDISLTARNIDIANSQLFAGILPGSGTSSSQAGNIVLNAQELVQLNDTFIQNTVGSNATGAGGDIAIDTGSLFVLNDSVLASEVRGEGTGGNIVVSADSQVVFDFESVATTNVYSDAIGIGGNIAVAADSLWLFNGSRLGSGLQGQGKSGDVLISVGSLDIFNGSQIGSGSEGQGDSGSILVNAEDQAVVRSNSSILSQIEEQTSVGDAGDITISADTLSIFDDSDISSSSEGEGNAGSIKITTQGQTSLNDRSAILSIVRGAEATGDGGAIAISAGNLYVVDRSQLGSGVDRGTGNAGSISIEVRDQVVFDADSNATTSTIDADGNGGDVDIEAAQLLLINGSKIDTRISGRGQGNAGRITADIQEQLVLDDNGLIVSIIGEGATGDAGDITLNARELFLFEGSGIVSRSAGRGSAGNISIDTEDAVALEDNSSIESVILPNVVGKGGQIEINAESLLLLDESTVVSSSLGLGDSGDITVRVRDEVVLSNIGRILSSIEPGATGNGGNIDISARSLTLQDDSQLRANSIGEGDAGSILINVSDELAFNNRSNAVTTIERDGIGNAGIIQINAGSLYLDNLSQLTSSTDGRGNAGNINIDSDSQVTLYRSQISSSANADAVGDAGDIKIEADTLLVTDDSASPNTAISSRTSGQGDAGDITLDISEKGTLFRSFILTSVASEDAVGDAGDIYIEADALDLFGSAITSRSIGRGDAGDIEIRNSRRLFAQDGGVSTISALTSGGNILISTDKIQLELDSDISSRTFGRTSDGGSITIEASEFIVALDDSDIIASASEGRGGNIVLRTPGFFGENFNSSSLESNPDSLYGNNRVDINATGGVDGEVTAPNVSFLENDLANLPDNLIVPDQLLANSCIARSTDGRGTLVETGRDGIYINPESVSAPSFATGTVQSTATQATDRTIEEPHEVYQLADGRLFMGKPCL